MAEVILEGQNLTKHYPVTKGLLQRTVGWVRAATGAAVNSRLVSRAIVTPTPSILENFFFIDLLFFSLLNIFYVSIDKAIKPHVPSLIMETRFLFSPFLSF